MSKIWEYSGWAAIIVMTLWNAALLARIALYLDAFMWFTLLGLYFFPLLHVLYMAMGFNVRERISRKELEKREEEAFKDE